MIFRLFFILFVLCFTPTQASECTAYETSHPMYLLDGAHLHTGKCVSCSSCHNTGVYIGTPTTCYSCHAVNALGTSSNVSVTQWSAAHIPTFTVSCGPVSSGCHTTTAFTPISSVTMNHTAVAAYRCDSCHNGSYTAYNAEGKPKSHPNVGTQDCGTSGCHTTKTFDK